MDSVNIFLETKDFVITETNGRIHTASKGGLSGVIQVLGKLVYELMTDSNAQPMATLEHTSEPDIRHYHFYTENQESDLAFSGVFSLNAVEQENFNPSVLIRQIKEQTCKLTYENDKINSEPEDWAIKSISRL